MNALPMNAIVVARVEITLTVFRMDLVHSRMQFHCLASKYLVRSNCDCLQLRLLLQRLCGSSCHLRSPSNELLYILFNFLPVVAIQIRRRSVHISHESRHHWSIVAVLALPFITLCVCNMHHCCYHCSHSYLNISALWTKIKRNE